MDSVHDFIGQLAAEPWHASRLVWLFCFESQVSEIVNSIRWAVDTPAVLTIDLDAGGPILLSEIVRTIKFAEVNEPLIEADLEHLLEELGARPEVVEAYIPSRTIWLLLSSSPLRDQSRAASTLAAIRLASTFIQTVLRIVVIDPVTQDLGISMKRALPDKSHSWKIRWFFPRTHSNPEDSSDTLDLGFAQLGLERSAQREEVGACLVLMVHPECQRLGSRYALHPNSRLYIGRSLSAAHISLPEVMSLSFRHARLRHSSGQVTIEDLGSTNGTFVNGRAIHSRTILLNGDSLQTAGVYFKLLHEHDEERAYRLAIYDLVERDSLTETYSRRTYEEAMRREFSRSRHYDRPLTLIVFDVDDFKWINGTYGRLCGDFVLRQVASLASDLVRPEQMLARVGSDEFVILATETSAAQAKVLATKLRDQIGGLNPAYGNLTIPIRCAFGFAELNWRMNTPQDLFYAASTALQQSKEKGQNLVTEQAG